MPAINSCTKCVGSQGIIHIHMLDCLPDYPEHGCMDDLKTEQRSFVSQATCVNDVLDMSSTSVLQPGTDRRPVDWCRN